jgi:hypothetical protein
MEIAIGASGLAKRNLDVNAESHTSSKTLAHRGTSTDAPASGVLSGFTHDSNAYRTLTRTIELAQKNALPGTENQCAIFNQNRLACARENGFHMGVSVSFRMAIWPMVGNQAIENAFDIARHVGIGVLVNCDARRGVGKVNVTDAPAYARIVHQVLHFASDIHELSPSGRLDSKRFHAARLWNGNDEMRAGILEA